MGTDTAGLRPARATIDLDRLAMNYAAISAAVGPPVMPVVKADAYGHGAARVGLHLEAQGATRLAVAYVEEAVALRRAGVRVPIVVLAGFWDGQEERLVEHRLTPVVSTPGTLERALHTAARHPHALSVHLKVDTGMTRLGFDREGFLAAAARLQEAPLRLEGVMTHLACADEDARVTADQLDRFDDAVGELGRRGIRPALIHACNSAGLAFVRPTHTLVRPGLILYGVKPRPLSPSIDVRPVMRVSGPIELVKDVPPGTPVSYGGRFVTARPTRLATVALGYADGVPRTDSMRERGAYAIHGVRSPIAGTVCMDLTMADVTGRDDVRDGDEAVFLGDDPSAWDVCGWAGTTAWQALTAIGPRVPRVYVEGGRVVDVLSPYL